MITDQDRIETAADNCEVLRARLAKYEDADGNPKSPAGWVDERATMVFVSEIERIADDYHYRSDGCDAELAISEMRDALKAALQARATLTAPAPGECVAVPVELMVRLCPVATQDGWKEWNTATAYEAAKELSALLAQQGKAVGDE